MEEGIVKTEDTAEAVGAETKETPPKTDVSAGTLDETFETPPEGGPEEPAAVKWADYGLPNLEGKDAKFVKDYFAYTSRRYGQQANELGDLRKGQEELKKLKEQITGEKAPEKKSDEISDLELAQFAQTFNENPLRALNEFCLPKMTDSLEEALYKRLEEKFGKSMTEKTKDLVNEQEYQAFVRDHPEEYESYKDVMHELMTDKYLGDDVSYKEVLKLAKLTQEEPSLFGITCQHMRAGFPFDESREYASLKQNAATTGEANKAQVIKDVDKIGAGAKHAATKQVTSEPKAKTMDEAFAPD